MSDKKSSASAGSSTDQDFLSEGSPKARSGNPTDNVNSPAALLQAGTLTSDVPSSILPATPLSQADTHAAATAPDDIESAATLLQFGAPTSDSHTLAMPVFSLPQVDADVTENTANSTESPSTPPGAEIPASDLQVSALPITPRPQVGTDATENSLGNANSPRSPLRPRSSRLSSSGVLEPDSQFATGSPLLTPRMARNVFIENPIEALLHRRLNNIDDIPLRMNGLEREVRDLRRTIDKFSQQLRACHPPRDGEHPRPRGRPRVHNIASYNRINYLHEELRELYRNILSEQAEYRPSPPSSPSASPRPPPPPENTPHPSAPSSPPASHTVNPSINTNLYFNVENANHTSLLDISTTITPIGRQFLDNGGVIPPFPARDPPSHPNINDNWEEARWVLTRTQRRPEPEASHAPSTDLKTPRHSSDVVFRTRGQQPRSLLPTAWPPVTTPTNSSEAPALGDWLSGAMDNTNKGQNNDVTRISQKKDLELAEKKED